MAIVGVLMVSGGCTKSVWGVWRVSGCVFGYLGVTGGEMGVIKS